MALYDTYIGLDSLCTCVAETVFYYRYYYCFGDVSKSPSDGNFFGLLLV